MGGGKSAGQAAVFLRDFAATVWMLVRGLDTAFDKRADRVRLMNASLPQLIKGEQISGPV